MQINGLEALAELRNLLVDRRELQFEVLFEKFESTLLRN